MGFIFGAYRSQENFKKTVSEIFLLNDGETIEINF